MKKTEKAILLAVIIVVGVIAIIGAIKVMKITPGFPQEGYTTTPATATTTPIGAFPTPTPTPTLPSEYTQINASFKGTSKKDFLARNFATITIPAGDYTILCKLSSTDTYMRNFIFDIEGETYIKYAQDNRRLKFRVSLSEEGTIGILIYVTPVIWNVSIHISPPVDPISLNNPHGDIKVVSGAPAPTPTPTPTPTATGVATETTTPTVTVTTIERRIPYWWIIVVALGIIAIALILYLRLIKLKRTPKTKASYI